METSLVLNHIMLSKYQATYIMAVDIFLQTAFLQTLIYPRSINAHNEVFVGISRFMSDVRWFICNLFMESICALVIHVT